MFINAYLPQLFRNKFRKKNEKKVKRGALPALAEASEHSGSIHNNLVDETGTRYQIQGGRISSVVFKQPQLNQVFEIFEIKSIFIIQIYSLLLIIW